MKLKELYKASLCGIDEIIVIKSKEKKSYDMHSIRKIENWFDLEVDSFEPVMKPKISEYDGSLKVEANIRVYCFVNEQ